MDVTYVGGRGRGRWGLFYVVQCSTLCVNVLRWRLQVVLTILAVAVGGHDANECELWRTLDAYFACDWEISHGKFRIVLL